MTGKIARATAITAATAAVIAYATLQLAHHIDNALAAY